MLPRCSRSLWGVQGPSEVPSFAQASHSTGWNLPDVFTVSPEKSNAVIGVSRPAGLRGRFVTGRACRQLATCVLILFIGFQALAYYIYVNDNNA